MGLVGAIASLSTGTYTVTRAAVGTVDAAGAYTQGAASTSTIVAVVVPATGAVLAALPEGAKVEDARVVYATADLRAASDGVTADSVGIDAHSCEPGAGAFVVVSSKPYPVFGDRAYEAVVVRQPVIPDADIDTALRAWAAAATGLPLASVVIEHQPKQPRPARPFVSLLLGDVSPVGQDWIATEDNPLTFLAPIVTSAVANATETMTSAAHGLQTGDGPVRLTTAGVLPAGLALLTDYWVIRVSASDFRLAASFYDANDGIPVAFSDDGTGAVTVSATPDSLRRGAEITQRVRGPRTARLTMRCFADGANASSARAYLSRAITRSSLDSVRTILTDANIGILKFARVVAVAGLANGLLEPQALVDVILSLVDEETETETIITSAQVELTPGGEDPIAFSIPAGVNP